VPDRIWDTDPRLHATAETERRRHRQRHHGRANGRELELIRFADMHPQLDARWVVKGLFASEQISVVFGEAGCGKTFLALDLALHVAAGREWFGRKVRQGAVVYVAAEAGRGIFNRVAAWRIEHGVNGQDIPFGAIPSPIDLCHPSGDLDTLIQAIRSAALGSIALIVIDTVSRALAGGNENGPDDMGALVQSVDRLRDELGCHLLLIHHCGKEPKLGARGHSLLKAAVDTEAEVVRYEKGSVATVTKQRDGIPGDPIAFRLRAVELGRDEDGDPVTSCIIEPTEAPPLNGRTGKIRLSSAQARALELLGEVITRSSEIPPTCDHIPANTACVPEELWRKYCYEGQITDSDKPGARQKAFKRSAEALVAAGYVSKWGTWVWIP
jgi:hypothetical protein